MFIFALRNLLSRPVRSLLALLGLTVAIAGMVGLFSVAAGLDAMVTSTLNRLPGIVAMQPGAPMPLFSKIPASWGNEIAALPGVHVVQPEVWARAHVVEGQMAVSPPRLWFGADIEQVLSLQDSLYRDDIVAGRFLNLSDCGTNNAVVSRQIADEYGKQVGDTLRVDGHDLTIVGIYHCGSLLLDVAIILDIDQARRLVRFDSGWISSLYVEPEQGVSDDELVAAINELFRGRELPTWEPSTALLGPPSSDPSPLGILTRFAARAFNPAPAPAESASQANPSNSTTAASETVLEVHAATDWSERLDRFSADLNIFLTLMTGIGVLIAVLSILNTMLMSVSERIIEFGVLKANGWSRTNVMMLITWESALLGVGGGLSGCLFGWIGTLVVNWYWPDKVHLYASPGLLLFSLAFSTALGILGGMYPAVWATRMTPMDAIRRG